jgi:hypothetical protein
MSIGHEKRKDVFGNSVSRLEQWAVDSGQGTVVSGQWSVVSGKWSVGSGQWEVVSGKWGASGDAAGGRV